MTARHPTAQNTEGKQEPTITTKTQRDNPNTEGEQGPTTTTKTEREDTKHTEKEGQPQTIPKEREESNGPNHLRENENGDPRHP